MINFLIRVWVAISAAATWLSDKLKHASTSQAATNGQHASHAQNATINQVTRDGKASALVLVLNVTNNHYHQKAPSAGELENRNAN
jgi:hypothetical protein